MLRHFVLISLIALASCANAPMRSHALNPLGWPAKVCTAVGWVCADSGLPLLRESGRLLGALGELGESPAMTIEGLILADINRLEGAAYDLVAGTGATITATWNLPFFIMPGRNVDLGRDADLVNEALARLEATPVDVWRTDPGDRREWVFPPGTRVRAAGEDLIWTVPGYGEVLQAAEANQLWNLLQWSVGTDFPAQERSWGFVVRSRARWDATRPRRRAVTILHEFYHQHMQMRQWLMGWTLIYWPAYNATFVFTGWTGHWAEMVGPHAAVVVNRALAGWSMR